MSQDSYMSAYAKICRKNNEHRKELIKKIKRADLVSKVVTCLYGNSTRASAYRDGLMDAFSIMYGDDETARLWNYLVCRGARVQRYKRYYLVIEGKVSFLTWLLGDGRWDGGEC